MSSEDGIGNLASLAYGIALAGAWAKCKQSSGRQERRGESTVVRIDV